MQHEKVGLEFLNKSGLKEMHHLKYEGKHGAKH